MAHPMLTPRKVGRHLLVLAVIAGCVVAGFWQLARLHQVRAYNAGVRRQLGEAALPVSRVLPAAGRPDTKAVAFRRVVATGHYEERDEVVLAGRSLGDTAGNDLLTPLALADGRAIVVNRGWVPFSMDQPPVAQAAPPSGLVRVTGVLLTPDGASGPATQTVTLTTRVDLSHLARQLPPRTLPVYLLLQSQDPAQRGRFPRPQPLPALDEGPHFSYAVQWFLFAAVGLVGYPILLRRELVARAGR
jgi:surfeit locus 1 family protein